MKDIERDERYKRAVLRVHELDKIDAKHGNKLPTEVDKYLHLTVCVTALEAGLLHGIESASWEALVMLHLLEKRMR